MLTIQYNLQKFATQLQLSWVDFTIIVPIVLIAILLTIVGRFLYSYLFVEHSFPQKIIKNSHLKANDPIIHKLLNDHFAYYRQLSATYKIEFRERTIKMISYFKWRSGKGEPITDEMRILISASAVQLLFGLPKIQLGHYNRIIVFNNEYFNNKTQQLHKGEVNAQSIVLSYNHFLDGYANNNDKINLGLHEMAHALDLSSFLSYGKRYFLRKMMLYFMNKTYQDFQNLQNGRQNFLRQYGGKNPREFFAVAVEHFFEAPEEFNEELPNLYRELCVLLNQDPLANLPRGVHQSRLKPKSNSLFNTIRQDTYHFKTVLSPVIWLPPFPSAFFMTGFSAVMASILTFLDLPFLSVFLGLMLAYTYTTLRKRLTKVVISGDYLMVQNAVSKRNQAIHINNILLANFEKDFNYYHCSLTYFDDQQTNDVDFRLYCDPLNFKMLYQYLASQNITTVVNDQIMVGQSSN